MLALLGLLAAASCDKFPLFNIFGEEERPSAYLVIKPILGLEQIKRVGSVYGQPGAGEGGVPHNGIDIGVDPGTPFVAGCRGIIIGIAPGRDAFTETVDVELRYNDELSLSYLFEPKEEIFVGKGDVVEEGAFIGTVGTREAGFIDQCVHFWVKRNGQAVCPVPYLRADLRRRLNDLYHLQGGGLVPNICGCPEHQHLFVP